MKSLKRRETTQLFAKRAGKKRKKIKPKQNKKRNILFAANGNARLF